MVSGQSEVQLVARTDYSVFYKLSANASAGWMNTHHSGTFACEGSAEYLRHLSLIERRQSGVAAFGVAGSSCREGRSPRVCLPSDKERGQEIVYRPNLVE